MEINDFIVSFREQFENTPADQFNPNTKFRELEEWDSMIALSLIAFVDDEYHTRLTGDDIRNSETIQDIFNIILAKNK